MTAAVVEAPLSTPESRFEDLPDYPFRSHYLTVHDAAAELRMHYVDEGPSSAPVALLLHGEPTWSFTWRGVISRVVDAGFRAVAPDHIGFGKSDKLRLREQYSYARYVDWMTEFVTATQLDNITLVAQDWGGPIGLSTLARMPDRFTAVVAATTLLPNCDPPPRGVAPWPGELIQNWVDLSTAAEDLPIADIVAGVTANPIGDAAKRGYDAPFPDARYKAAALQFPALIPIAESMPGIAENRQTWEILRTWHKPFVTAFSDSDPTTKAWEKVFRDNIPGARNSPHTEIKNAGHFVQEEQPDALADVVIACMRRAQAPI